jgi:hypothetical protein
LTFIVNDLDAVTSERGLAAGLNPLPKKSFSTDSSYRTQFVNVRTSRPPPLVLALFAQFRLPFVAQVSSTAEE